MKRLVQTLRIAVTALVAGGLLASQAPAQPIAQPHYADPIVIVQADCYSVGQQIAAENGGTLARATASNQGGQPVCIIVVLVPGRDGERPRRQQFVVPGG